MSAALPETVEIDDLGPTTALARGGLGAVDVLADPGAFPSSRPLVLKRFHRPAAADGDVLRALVRWRLDLEPSERASLDRVATWPLSVVSAGAEVIGFLMHRVPAPFEIDVRLPSGRRRRALREAQYLLGTSDRCRQLGLDDADVAIRRGVVWDLAETVDFLHDRGVVVGDLSARNVLWRPDTSEVLLVDCDSMSLARVGSPHPPTTTVDWDDPWQRGYVAASADVYKLALFSLRTHGRSFQSRDPAIADAALDGTGRYLLRRSLSEVPSDRPRAEAWAGWAAGRRAAAAASRD